MTEGHNHIRSIFARWQRLEDAKKDIGDDLKELFQEARSAGFEPKALRVAFREKVKSTEKAEKDRNIADLVDTYLIALGESSDAYARVTRAREAGDTDLQPALSMNGPHGGGSSNAGDDMPRAGAEPTAIIGGQFPENAAAVDQAGNEAGSSAPPSATTAPRHGEPTIDPSRQHTTLTDDDLEIPDFLRRAKQ